MINEQNQGEVVAPEANEPATDVQPQQDAEKSEADTIAVPKEEYDSMKETLGSLKRELKDSKKAVKESKPEAGKDKNKSDEFGLLEITFLNGKGIESEDEVNFVTEQLKEAGLSKENLPKLLDNKYFQSELQSFRDQKATVEATSDVEGGGSGTGNAKNTPEYWIAKGAPPTRDQVPDRKTRAAIARAFMDKEKSGKTFYSD